MNEKAALRAQIRRIQKSIPKQTILRDSDKVFENFKKILADHSFSAFFCYVSYGAEVDTASILQYLYTAGKCVLVPVVRGKRLLAARWAPEILMKRNILGILEPENPDLYAGRIDAAIIPGLAFDKKAARLGQGGGYYDRWLSGKDVFRIGLCFSWQVFDALPTEETDCPMHVVLSEKEILYG